jgi:hypothetical protein
MVSNTKNALVGIAPPVQTDNETPTGGNNQAIAENYLANATETYDELAFTDPLLRGDVDSIKSYCDRADADVIACRANASWTDNSHWWNVNTMTERAPQAGENILIPTGFSVIYDQDSTTKYGWIRCDGDWTWSDTVSTQLWIDTMFFDHTSAPRLASESTPAPSTITQKVVYTNNGPLDVTNDPMKMQRGLVCFGQASIFGTPVIGITRATAGIAQGATSVTLDRAVMSVPGFRDWKVGDELIIPGTRMRGHASNWEDWETEIRTITAIDNSTPTAPVISWSGGLTYPHPACFRRATFTPHIVNRTRNFQTWTEGEPADAQRRAHQLFKNKDQNTIQYVEAWAMGRTDMDYLTLGASPVKLGSQALTSTTNTNGRYTWHFHRNGADDPTLNPSVFRGCVGYDSPGWVFVHHDSHGKMIDCIAYDFQAVGFAGEGGGSFGEVNGCIAINSRQSWSGPSTARIKDGGHGIGDIGHAFWSNSRPLNFKNCIATCCTVGLAWTSRVDFETNVYPGITEELRAFYGLVALPDTTVRKTFAVIEGFENNEAYACNWGGSVAKKLVTQHHDLISKLDGFTAWEVDTGFHWQYTGMYLNKDFDVIGFDQNNRAQPPWNPGDGLQPFRQTLAQVFLDPKVENFSSGIAFTVLGGINTAANKQHKVINPTFTSVTRNYSVDGTEITLPWSNPEYSFTDIEELATGDLGSSAAGDIVPGYIEDSCTWAGGGNNFVIGHDFTLSDSIGLHTRQRGIPDPSFGWGLYVNGQNEANNSSKSTKDVSALTLITALQMQLMIKAEGVYTSAAGDKVLLIPDVAQDRTSGETTYFYTPVALRMPSSEFYAILPDYDSGTGDNGALGSHTDASGIVQDFTSFDPAGTNGLIP